MVELLAPSGNWDCVKAAVCNGANAVYLGGKLFSARAYANNFDIEELKKVCDYCHSYSVRVYVTVNTLYKNEEFEELMSFIGDLYVMGVDALIMQDLGAISLVRKNWPDFPVHASTQLTANSIKDVQEFEKLGLSTVVLSRELNLEEIKEIAANTALRVETFIHGALCVSYSGQCYMSSVLGKRSGNRGKCAQNCRLNYSLESEDAVLAEGRLLSPKDICTLDVLPQLLDSGVSSLKIEGRMKSAEYVAGVTSIYRKYIDMYYEDRKNYKVAREDRLILQQLFNRGGFSEGYFRTHSGNKMMCTVHPKNWGLYIGRVKDYRNNIVTIDINKPLKNGDGIEVWTADEEGVGSYINRPCNVGLNRLSLKGDIKVGASVYQTYDKELFDELASSLSRERYKSAVAGKVELFIGKASRLTLSNGQLMVSVESDEVQEAVNQPLTDELIYEQLSKLGNTPFDLVQLEIYKDDSCYVNRRVLNNLKSEACGRLLEKMIVSSKRKAVNHALYQKAHPQAQLQRVSVTVRNEVQLNEVLKHDEVDLIYLEYSRELASKTDALADRVHRSGKKLVLKLPRIWRRYVYERIDFESFRNIDGYLISCLGHLNSVEDRGKDIYLDHTGNVINNYSFDFWLDRGCRGVTMSVESSVNEMVENEFSEVVAYGRLPLMITHQCPVGNYVGHKEDQIYCDKFNHGERYHLRSGSNEFELITDCDNCLCSIYSEKALEEIALVKAKDCGHIRFSFLNEDVHTIKEVFKKYQSDTMPLAAGYYSKGIE